MIHITVHDPKVLHRWESVTLWENVLFLDLLGTPKFWESQVLGPFIFCIILQPYQLLWHRLFYFSNAPNAENVLQERIHC